jgi:hypothetical protein
MFNDQIPLPPGIITEYLFSSAITQKNAPFKAETAASAMRFWIACPG